SLFSSFLENLTYTHTKAYRPIKDSVCWLIEIKDYRRYQRTKAIDLADEIALKMRDSLAMIAVARINAYDATESAMAQSASRCSQMRIVLHLEQPNTHSKLFPRAINLANVQDKLKKLIKSVDPHPQVVEMSQMRSLSWSVSSIATATT
ncbi:MAG: hypothetical protein NT023_01525, partial [Armatimonadetes bacterium]|nr:hypothetical protein [Armatimonadota bacterium]